MDLVVGCGTSANYPEPRLCIVTGIDSAVDFTIGVCALTVATMGWVHLRLGWKV